MKEIHHRCRCTRQAFTFDEWCAYCKAHSSGEIVYTFGTFGFNINDVCMTPNVPVKFDKGDYSIEVRTAQSPNGRWENGYSYNFCRSGGGHPAVFVSDQEQGFPSEKEAVYDALEYLEERCLREIDESRDRVEYDDDGNVVKNVSALPRLTGMLAQIRRYKEIYNPQQLSLFD